MPKINVSDWRKHARATGLLKVDMHDASYLSKAGQEKEGISFFYHPIVDWFWNVIYSMSEANRAKVGTTDILLCFTVFF